VVESPLLELVLVSLPELVLELVPVSVLPLLTLLLVVQSEELVPELLLEPVVESLQLLEVVSVLVPEPEVVLTSLGTMLLLVELSEVLDAEAVVVLPLLPEELLVLVLVPESLQLLELLLSVELLVPVLEPVLEWWQPPPPVPESLPEPEPVPTSEGTILLLVKLSEELDVELLVVELPLLELVLVEDPLPEPEVEWWQPPESSVLVPEELPVSLPMMPGPWCETPAELSEALEAGPLLGPGGGPPGNPFAALGTSRRSSCSSSSRKVLGRLALHPCFHCPRAESHFQSMLTSSQERPGRVAPGVLHRSRAMEFAAHCVPTVT
jgi:hypothetical protein